MPSPHETSQLESTPTTTGRRTVKQPGENPQVSDFFELSRKVKDAGLMQRRVGRYITRMIFLGLALAGAFALLFTLGDTYWQLAVSALICMLFPELGLVPHDASHQQIFSSGKRNAWFSRICGNLIVGLSYGWWTRKHGRHHANPDTVGKDGDIATGALVFIPEEAERTGFMGWVTRRQGWLFFPLLCLFALALHYNSVKSVLQNRKLKHRRVELALLAFRFISFPLLVLVVLGPGLGSAFMGVQLLVFGVYMGGSFAPNHKGMPLIPHDSKIDFLSRQVLTSRNIRGGKVVDWAMGGLTYQIEHQLFHRMPSAHLPLLHPMLRQQCEERRSPYTQAGLIESYAIVVKYLNRVGLGYADPMDGPMVSAVRPP